MTRRRKGTTLTGMLRAIDPSVAPRWSNRFQVRLLGYLVLFSLVTSLAAGYVYYTRQVNFVADEQEKRGKTLIRNLAGQSELGAYSGDRAFLIGPARRTFAESDVTYVAIYDRTGKALIRLMRPGVRIQPRLAATLRQPVISQPARSPLTRSHAQYDDLLAAIVTVAEDPEQSHFGSAAGTVSAAIGVARLGLSRRPAEEKLAEVLRWGIYLSLAVLAMGTVLALFLARRMSRPILALAAGAEQVRSGKLGYQIGIDRRDELGALAASFNRMSADLQRTVESLAHLNRNLEHTVAQRTLALRRSRDFVALLNAPLRLRTLLDGALDALVRSTRSAAGAMFLHRSGNTLELSVCQGVHAEAFAMVADAPNPIAEAASTGEIRVLRPVPEKLPLARTLPAAEALLCAPARSKDRVVAIAVLALTSELSADETQFVQDATAQLAIAVSNARAFSETERLARELEQRNVALLQQRDQLQELNRLKTEFLANISHELRTPLNAIIGYSELIADGIYGEVNREQLQSLSGIRESATNLVQLINEILDLSKLESGKMPAVFAEVDLNRLLQEVVAQSAPLARKRPYDISVQLPRDAVLAATDATKVRQILLNLLSNAVKFTEHGSVTARLVQASEGGARISIEDTGIGIPADQLRVIFDEFRQVDGSSTREHGGTGLGLAISHRLARVINGRIEVTSTLKRGSVFTLHLPGPQATAESNEATSCTPVEVAVTVRSR